VKRDVSAPLRASDLRHSVTIHAPAGTLDQVARDVETGVPAAITVTPVPFQTPERLAAGGLQAQTLYSIGLRYRTDLRPDYVLVEECCTQRQFQILAIVPSDRRDAIDMRCVTAD
jgi:hypothetical protein